MQQSQIDLTLGCRPQGNSGQWIEATVIVEDEDRFHFQADLCSIHQPGDYERYHVEQDIDHPLTAELALALLAFVAQPPFSPTAGGLSVMISGESAVANRAATRILEPEVRAGASSHGLPEHIGKNLRKSLAD